jgi:hypothetical protein
MVLPLVVVCWVSRDPHGWGGRFSLSLFVQAMSSYGKVKSVRLVRDIGE